MFCSDGGRYPPGDTLENLSAPGERERGSKEAKGRRKEEGGRQEDRQIKKGEKTDGREKRGRAKERLKEKTADERK